jgi:predicted acylesterase/phospholipase RssA
VTDGSLVVVLSGGGAKTAAHVGAMRVLEERGVRPSRFVGTSMGAVVGAAFAAGLTYDEVLERVLTLSRRDIARVSWTLLMGPYATSLLQPDRLRRTIEFLVPARRFSQLSIPLTVTAVDAANGDLVLFGDGGDSRASLVDALTAACSLPVFYPPAILGGRELVDGGLRSVLPLGVAAAFEPRLMIGIRVGPSFRARPAASGGVVPPLLQAHNRAMRTLMAAQTDAEISRWRGGSVPLILVEPEVHQAATFAIGKVVAYVEEGYRRTVEAVERSSYRDLLRASPSE